jgi:hypothetical protein
MLPAMRSDVSQQQTNDEENQNHQVQNGISQQTATSSAHQTNDEVTQNHQVREGGENVDTETLIEAYLVEEGRESLDVDVAVYEGMVTVVSPESGGSKRWLIILMSAICMLLVLMAALLAVYLYGPQSTASSSDGESTSKSWTNNKNEDLILAKNSTSEPTLSLSESPSLSPSASPSHPCFQSKAELEVAIKLYIEQDCTTNIACSAGKT